MCLYFSHDANAHRHRKMRKLRGELGWRGYGLYWAIVEILREERDYRLPTDYKALKVVLDAPAKLIERIVTEFDLFSVDEDGYFYSQGLNERMERVYNNRYSQQEENQDPPTAQQARMNEKLREKRKAAGKAGAESRWGLANDSKADGKTMANDSKADGKTMANDSKADGKTMANDSKSDGKTMANDSKSDGKMGVGGEDKRENINNNNISPPPSTHIGTHTHEAQASPECPTPLPPSPNEGEVPPRGHAIVVALLETYNEMRCRDSRWSACLGITADMERDALESFKHYGSIDNIREAMRRAESIEWIKSKNNISRLAWLIKLKNLLAIDEGAYGSDHTRPQMSAPPKTAGVPLPIDDQKMESLRRRFEANIIQPTQ